MSDARNVVVFWLCALLSLAIVQVAVGTIMVLDAVWPGANPHAVLPPGGGLMALLLGLSLFGVVFRRRWLVGTFAALLLAVSATLTVWLALGLPASFLPIRIQPQLTAVSSLIALAILVMAGNRLSAPLARLIGLAAALVGLLSLASLWLPALSWLNLGTVPESTLVISPLVMLTGAVLPGLGSVWQQHATRIHWPVVVVGAVGILVVTLTWHLLRTQNSHHRLNRAEVLADQIVQATTTQLADKTALIRRLSERWADLPGVPDVRTRKRDLGGYLRDYPDIKLILLLDSRDRLLLSEAKQLSYRFWLHDFLRQPAIQAWLEHLQQTQSPHLSQPLVMPNGSALGALGVPYEDRQGDPYLLLAVFDLTSFLSKIARVLDDDLTLRVSAGNALVYGYPQDTANPKGQGGATPSSVLVTRNLNDHHDGAWQVDVGLSRGPAPRPGLFLPPMTLFTGLGLSFLVMLSQLLWREAERRSGTYEDLSEQLQAHLNEERRLRATNERILEFSKDILCSIDAEGTFLQVSPACESVLGYRPEALVGQHYTYLLEPEDRAATEAEVARLVSGEQRRSHGFRTRLYHRRGQVVTVAWTAEWDTNERVLFCVGRDISDELTAEALSRERDQFFSLSPDMFCIVDLNSYFFEINQAFVDNLGYAREALLGTSYLNLVHPDDHRTVTTAVASLLEGDSVKDLLIRALDSQQQEHWLTLNATLSGDDLIYVVARDVTEQRAIEEKLRENDALLQMAERVAMLGGWVLDLQTGKSTWSDAVCAIHDLPEGQAPDLEDALTYYLPEHRQRITDAVQLCIRTGIPFDEELQIRTAKGRIRWVRAIGHPIKDESNQVVRLQGAFQDVTASHQALEQIRRFAERQSTIFESITDAFFTVDRDWRFTYVNQRSEELLRTPRSELLGNRIWDVFPAAVGTVFEEQYRRAVSTGESVSFEGYYEPLDNWLEISAYPSEEGLAVYYRSIRERKEAQWQLEKAMAELERSNRELQEFAFVASHDLQEPLRKIQAFSDRLMIRSDRLDEKDRDYLKRMQSAAGRMQKLIEDLLSYSRVTTRARAPEVCDTSAIARDVLGDLETAISRSGAVITLDDLPPVLGDPSQLRQVFQNLLSNAIKFQKPDHAPTIHVYAEEVTGASWTLVVSDNGIGFDERYAAKLFHPFQRLHQKEGYAGTGIGLAIVKKILDRHGATITVNSLPGTGTTFRIRFTRGN
ncbi:PAS domain S-box protein [Marinobacter sp. C2H3]|uniref:PAS domain S-box protein n=1 Tax=Marinobacter sp. C2H3 TaxID=3119003 RepID=UPI00300F07CB